MILDLTIKNCSFRYQVIEFWYSSQGFVRALIKCSLCFELNATCISRDYEWYITIARWQRSNKNNTWILIGMHELRTQSIRLVTLVIGNENWLTTINALWGTFNIHGDDLITKKMIKKKTGIRKMIELLENAVLTSKIYWVQ